ncbi:hypothetical protein [Aliamphritea ceti]|uniref:hypothetical protein n=1 Tax=Aliamphritea ceti TaxID=1524258 RepID=UPI0021C3D618|nr:hypothetical protein [Aliamphritea ceti]
MKRLIVDIEDLEFVALETAAVDPREWLKNFVGVRVKKELAGLKMVVAQHCMNEGVSLPTTEAEIISLGISNGWIKTAAQRQAEAEVVQASTQA